MKFNKYIQKLNEIVGSGTGAGGGSPDTTSGDRLTGGDVAVFQNRINLVNKRNYPYNIKNQNVETIEKWTNQPLKYFK